MGLPVNRGKYNFDRVVVDFYRVQRRVAFKCGEFDFIEHQAKNWLNNYQLPAVLRGDVIRGKSRTRSPARPRRCL